MSRSSKWIAALCVSAALACAASAAMAQGFNMFGPPPAEPGDNHAMAMAQGRQFVGLGGKCIDVERQATPTLVLRDCDPNSISQRFKFEGGNFKTAARFLTPMPSGMGTAPQSQWTWEQNCIAAVDQWRLILSKCANWQGRDQGPITWRLNGREIRSGNACFDVRMDQTANGTPIIHWGCQGKANQQWTMR